MELTELLTGLSGISSPIELLQLYIQAKTGQHIDLIDVSYKQELDAFGAINEHIHRINADNILASINFDIETG